MNYNCSNTKKRSRASWYISLLASSSALAFLSSVDGFHSTGILLPKTAFDRMDNVRLSVLERKSGESDRGRRVAEFMNLEPVQESEARKARLERDRETKDSFAEYGDELWALRKKMTKLSERLVEDLNGDQENEELIRHELREAEQRDPELVYEMEMLEMELANRDGDEEQALKARERALNARSCLPHFNLEGLWVGKYGNHGYEMINVTYVGDTMIAYKVTGDKNVPRGEITFQADLAPTAVRRLRTARGKFSKISKEDMKPLEPIMLTDKAASKWGTRQLPRYRGLGQVAENGFENHRWMDGQLIIIGEEYFSFAWVPLENQIFFGRPSPELALKMLREGGQEDLRTRHHWDAPPSLDEDINVLKDFVESCLEKTAETFEEELPAGEPFSCIWAGNADTEECYFE